MIEHIKYPVYKKTGSVFHVIRFGITVLLLFLFLSCSKNRKFQVTADFIEFMTDVNITAYNVSAGDTSVTDSVLMRSQEIFLYFNSTMNPYLETSDLYAFNRNETTGRIAVPEQLRHILRISHNIYKYTDGAFDPAVFPLVNLWSFNTGTKSELPSENKIKSLLAFSSLEYFSLRKDSVIFPDSRAAFDLSAIAKGYAVDSVAAYLKNSGIKDFIVEAGGDLLVNSSSKRSIGIRHPRKKGSLIDTLYVKKGAVATSGDYENYVIKDGIRYCHIIDPDTGYGTSDIISATVITEKAYESDAFATAVFVLGREKGRYFLIENGLSGLIIYKDRSGQIIKEGINLEGYEEQN